MKVNFQLIKILTVSILLTSGVLGLIITSTPDQRSPLLVELPLQSIQATPNVSSNFSSKIFTYYVYLPIISKPVFDYVSFPVTGPGYAVPAVDNRYIYVGSGFSIDCLNTGEIRAFDKETLTLVWKTDVTGAIGDTTLTLANNQVIFGAGDGLVALAVEDGHLVWQQHLNGCFQESFIRLHQDRIYLGSSSGDIYSLTTQGQVVWQNHLPDSVFAAPAVFSNTLYFVDMSNTLTTVDLNTGQILWQKTLPLNPDDLPGIFAGPLLFDNSLFIATYSGDVWRISPTGQIEAQYSGGNRYIASPIICNGQIAVANLEGQVDWLEITNLQLRFTVTTPEPFLFGTPHCVNDINIVTSYGAPPPVPSALYYLQRGQILKRLEFPCCKEALTTTLVDNFNIYNVLTGPDEVDLTRTWFALP